MQEKLMVKRQVTMRDSGTLVGRQTPLIWIRRFPEMVPPWSASARDLLVEVSGGRKVKRAERCGAKRVGLVVHSGVWVEEGGEVMII
jgi:hypothetical protein